MIVSAFDQIQFIDILETDYESLDNQFLEFIKRDQTEVIFNIGDRGAYRIDLIARDVYGKGNRALFWIILEYNAVTHIEELNTGRSLKIPTLESIMRSYSKWKSLND